MADDPSRCRTLVVTGFRPFPGVRVNPSALLVESLERDDPWSADPELQLRTRLLDTVYAGMRDQLGRLLSIHETESAPAALILTGYSSLATGLKIETRATSLCSPNHADASGFTPPSRRDPVQAATNDAVDFVEMVADLRKAEIPAHLSQDAGEYVCNNAYWHALDLIGTYRLPTRAVFLHVPAVANMDETPNGSGAMALDEIRRGVAIMAGHMLD